MPRGTQRSSRVFKSVLSRAEKELALGSEKAGDFHHNGIRGDERAASLMRFLQSHLPITMAIAKGEAIDFRDKRSGQLDLIIYDKSASAPIFTGGENVLVPAEALYAVIEVKSVLSKDELEKSVEAAKTIRSLRPFKEPFIGPRRDGIAAEDGRCRCAYSIFAYSTNLGATDWLQKEYMRTIGALDAAGAARDVVERVVVLGRGLINPATATGKEITDDNESIFLEYYLHLMNFLSRESARRPQVDWQIYTSRGTGGWKKLSDGS